MTTNMKSVTISILKTILYLLMLSAFWDAVRAKDQSKHSETLVPKIQRSLTMSSSSPLASSVKQEMDRNVNFLNFNYSKSSKKRSSSYQRPCHALQRPDSIDGPLGLDEKLILSSLVLQGRLISRSSVYRSLYFASFRVLKVLKGSMPKRMRRLVRLMFKLPHKSTTPSSYRVRSISGYFLKIMQCHSLTHFDSNFKDRECNFPVKFHVKPATKYIIFLKTLGPGKYVAVATPDTWTKHAKRTAKKVLCRGCAYPPKVVNVPKKLTADEGKTLKIKCKTYGRPRPEISWFKNGYRITPNLRSRIKSKKRRSILRISNVHQNDAGNYSCRATNILGTDSQSASITIRYLAPEPSVSNCPISSFCLNGGSCLYYEFIGELVCRCMDGYAGQRCQFKKAQIKLPFVENETCGPYGHDINFREICAAWRKPPENTELTKAEYDEWQKVEQQLTELKRQKLWDDFLRFRGEDENSASETLPKLEALALTSYKNP